MGAGVVLILSIFMYVYLGGLSGPSGSGNGGGGNVLKPGLYYLDSLHQAKRWENLAAAIEACINFKNAILATEKDVVACTAPRTRKPSGAAYVANGRAIEPPGGVVGAHPISKEQHVGAMSVPNFLYMRINTPQSKKKITTVTAQFYDKKTAISAGFLSAPEDASTKEVIAAATDVQARALVFYKVPAGDSGEFALVVKEGALRGCIAYVPFISPRGPTVLMYAFTPSLLPTESTTLFLQNASTGSITVPGTKSPTPLSIDSLAPKEVFAPPSSAPHSNIASKIVFVEQDA